jgi:hypothetical protein
VLVRKLQGFEYGGVCLTLCGLVLQVTSGESRARMGEVAHQRSDTVILTDSDPGLEAPQEIIQASGTRAGPLFAPPWGLAAVTL